MSDKTEVEIGRRISWVVAQALHKVAEAEGGAGRAFSPADTLDGQLDQILACASAASRSRAPAPVTLAEYTLCWILRDAGTEPASQG